MKQGHFNQTFSHHKQVVDNLLADKGEEYASDVDRLHNFKRGAEILRTTDEEVCLAFLAKHLVSIIDMIRSDKGSPIQLWDEKIGDAIAYLYLLWAIQVERKDQGVPLGVTVAADYVPSEPRAPGTS